MASVNAHLVWPLLVRPTLSTIRKKNAEVANSLTIALGNAENTDPGFLHDLLIALYNNNNIKRDNESSSLNMTESLLHAQGRLSNEGFQPFTLNPHVQQLVERTFILKKLLARVPNEVLDRAVFLGTIKEIASAIKKILDSLDSLIAELPAEERRLIEHRKRLLVKNAKQFSQALKFYFKGSLDVNDIFNSAAQLIYDVHLIEKLCHARSTSR